MTPGERRGRSTTTSAVHSLLALHGQRGRGGDDLAPLAQLWLLVVAAPRDAPSSSHIARAALVVCLFFLSLTLSPSSSVHLLAAARTFDWRRRATERFGSDWRQQRQQQQQRRRWSGAVVQARRREENKQGDTRRAEGRSARPHWAATTSEAAGRRHLHRIAWVPIL